MLKLTYLYTNTKTKTNTNVHTNININADTDTHTNINICFPPLLKPGIALSNPLISKSSRLTKGILQAFKSSVHTVSYCTNVSLYNREQKNRNISSDDFILRDVRFSFVPRRTSSEQKTANFGPIAILYKYRTWNQQTWVSSNLERYLYFCGYSL